MSVLRNPQTEHIAEVEKRIWLKEYDRMARELKEIAQATRTGPSPNHLVADRLDVLAGQMVEDLMRASCD